MPGLHGKEIDTTDWTAHEWRRARIWNVVFFVAWIAFFAYALADLLHHGNWLMFALTFAIAVFGVISQVVWLVRVSIWLKGNKNL